jgi:Sec-independent protein translocase protein TatA
VDGVTALTIGMATYNDFNGVYFTLQALRLYQDLQDTELLVVDNYGCPATKELVEGWVHGARYVPATEVRGTAAAKDRVFREAHGEAVLCCDSHVLLAPGAIRRLKEYYREHPECPDLLQGPVVYDDLQTISTHFDPVWRAEMWGIWATDPRGQDPEGEPFEIPMQGLGVFSCRKGAWPGFNPMFRGFGGEEGYIHEKFRQAGGRCLCLPWLRWTHRFGRPAGIEYPLTVEEKLRNYVIGHAELGLDPTPVLAHFSEILPEDHVVAVAAEALEGPPQAPEPTATTPHEVDAGAAGGGAAAPATLTEEADQVLQSPLLQHLPSPLLALLLIVFGPKRIGQMARGVVRFTSGAPNSVEEGKAKVLQAVEDKPRREVVERPTTANQDGMPGDPKECQPVQPVHQYPDRATLRILEATYGSGEDVVDVTAQLQALVRNGRLYFTVSNDLFSDPCLGKLKTLRFTYQLPGDDRRYAHEADEHRIVLLPRTGTKNVGIFYTNQSVPPKYLSRVLKQLEKAQNVDILTCPWYPIQDNPFPELEWFYHVPHHLTITLQILKLLHTAREVGSYEYVFFLEHDVLYPEGYFDIDPFSEDVLSNTNYIGLCEDGFQPNRAGQEALHQLAMKLPAAIEHFTSCLPQALTLGGTELEPNGRLWATRRSAEPAVHINHGSHFTSHFEIYSRDEIEKSHPYWGAAASWWD